MGGVEEGLTVVLGRDLGLVWRFDLVLPALPLDLFPSTSSLRLDPVPCAAPTARYRARSCLSRRPVGREGGRGAHRFPASRRAQSLPRSRAIPAPLVPAVTVDDRMPHQRPTFPPSPPPSLPLQPPTYTPAVTGHFCIPLRPESQKPIVEIENGEQKLEARGSGLWTLGVEIRFTHKRNGLLLGRERHLGALHVVGRAGPAHQRVLPPAGPLERVPVDEPALRLALGRLHRRLGRRVDAHGPEAELGWGVCQRDAASKSARGDGWMGASISSTTDDRRQEPILFRRPPPPPRTGCRVRPAIFPSFLNTWHSACLVRSDGSIDGVHPHCPAHVCRPDSTGNHSARRPPPDAMSTPSSLHH